MKDSAHVQLNDRGYYVYRIQRALTMVLLGLGVGPNDGTEAVAGRPFRRTSS